jgi:hypothetical protein
MDEKKFYKIKEKTSIVMFCYNISKDYVNGVIEEYKTDYKLTLFKHNNCHLNASKNSIAQAMIRNAVEITEEEYNIAVDVLKAMINTDEMYLDINVKTPTSEIKSETIYI